MFSSRVPLFLTTLAAIGWLAPRAVADTILDGHTIVVASAINSTNYGPLLAYNAGGTAPDVIRGEDIPFTFSYPFNWSANGDSISFGDESDGVHASIDISMASSGHNFGSSDDLFLFFILVDGYHWNTNYMAITQAINTDVVSVAQISSNILAFDLGNDLASSEAPVVYGIGAAPSNYTGQHLDIVNEFGAHVQLVMVAGAVSNAPEPASTGLALAGLTALVLRRRRSTK